MQKIKSPLFFSLAKWVSLTVATLALIGSLFALLTIAASFGSGSFTTPKFSDENVQEQLSFGLAESDAQSQQEYLDITNQYGQKILSVITRHGITTIKTDEMVHLLQRRIPDPRRDHFVSGWERFMDDGIAYMKKNNRMNEQVANKLTSLYVQKFQEAVSNTKAEEAKKAAGREFAITAFGLAALLFVVAMVVPVLISIERNTRAVSVAPVAATPGIDSPPPQHTPAAVCPHCAAPIVTGDAFCGECGTRLS
ncbi:MAG: zinc ribbon domain-containing protein [Zoogloeaceae bacterium]|jgi:hypothetical protein|nr:zinc ribbon domain-containing protein [Zoogloeaceae bacterium]